ncbi:MAG: tyrosine-type recombinase/integrase [Lachnospiraceae bacterium]|nr:tyrosine-type recombinase/integrase [Lachnospiraceae bacterium]
MVLKEEVDKYLHYCEFQKELDSKTIRAYRMDLEQFIAFMKKYDEVMGKEEINSYLLYIHDMYRQKTVKRKIASVKALFRYLEEEEIIELDPFHKIKTKFKEETVLPKIVPRSVIEQLLDYLYKEMASADCTQWHKKMILRDIAVVEMLFATGLRISELCHLQRGFFDSQTGVLCIQGKGGKERYLQIGSSDVLNILNAYSQKFEKNIKEHGYFFVNRYGQPLSEQSARRMIHRHAAAIHADRNITPHMFRHSFATFLMEEDVNIRYIQKMLGHASITTTQIYTYVATEKEREILRTRHPRNKMLVGQINL